MSDRSERKDADVADSDIAVIGMACRFPGAGDLEAFWENLRNGVESITFLHDEDLVTANPTYRTQPNFRAAAGLLPDIEQFDAAFFGYSAREAEVMDPQQRLFLECAWEAFEDSGYVPNSYPGLVGVYAGCGINTYFINNVHPACGYFPNRTFLESIDDFHLMIGNQNDFLTTRVSYKLNLRGPSINLQTACSTSLVAVHLACQALLLGECDMALAGSVTLRVPQNTGYLHEDSMVFSPDGHTRAFDVNAQGTTFGSGVAAVLLKSLRAAIADGDVIHAVIKGSAVNNDGALKLGFTAPSVDGQAAVIREAMTVAEVDPASIGYVEAHGTGTSLGDPVELSALSQAFGTLPAESCALGTAKTNLGHLSWSAGMAGLIKTILALKHRQIPPSLNYKAPNPRADMTNSPFRVNTRLSDWPRRGGPRRAGVSAFGLGGTNAHIILEEPPEPCPKSADRERTWHVFTLGAKCDTALGELVRRYQDYLAANPQVDLADLCYTANIGRSTYPHRRAIPATSVQMLRDELAMHATALAATQDRTQSAGPTKRPAPKKIAFLFTGQGAQYVGMGRQIYETHEEFRRILDHCDMLLRNYWDVSLLNVLYPMDTTDRRLHDVAHTQAAMFAFEYALASLWLSWGIKPAVVMGHSTGEYAAACIAGVFSLEDGLRLSAERGRLFESLVSNVGCMATVNAPEELVARAIAAYTHDVSIAAVNGPLSTVISGRTDAVDVVCRMLAQEGVTAKTLEIQRAGHSPLTEPMIEEFRRVAASITYSPPRIPIVSNLTGRIAGADITTPDYWCRHTRQAVRFADGIGSLAREGVDIFLEIGPDPVLLGMGAYCLLGQGALWVPSLRRPLQVECAVSDDWQHLTAGLAKLYAAGCGVDWEGFDRGYRRRRVSLPTYPFQRQRHWIEAATLGVPDAPSDGTEGAKANWRQWLLTVDWQRREATAEDSAVADQRLQASDPGIWLILADAGGVGEQIADYLGARGERCLRVYAATEFVIGHDGRVQLHPGTPEHFPRLFDLIDAPLRGVVHLWGLDVPDARQLEEGADALQAVWAGCEGLLGLVQAATNRDDAPLSLSVATRGAQTVLPDDPVAGLAQSALWGLSRVIGMEHQEMRCLRVDLGAEPYAGEVERLLAEIMRGSNEDTVAFRSGQRYVARLASVGDIVQTRSAVGEVASIRSDGSYLITGGLGGVGLLLAQWLVERGARHLILLGRRTPSDEAATAVVALEGVGASVSVVRADVAEAQDLSRVFTGLEGRPPLLGIFHAAGVIDDGVIQQQSREHFLKVLRPKVQGAWNLHRLAVAQAPQLEHFVLFSSAASLLGNAGQANHASANAFLDTLAHYRRANGCAALAINWGAWSKVGELRKNATARRRLERIGFDPIDSADGLEALGFALAQPWAQLGVSPMNWANFLREFHLEAVPFYQAFVTRGRWQQSPAATLRSRLSGKSLDEREALLLEHVRAQAVHVLGLKATGGGPVIDDNRQLSEYGIDSLSAIELRNSLQLSTGQSLPATLVMECPTVAEIACHLGALPFAEDPDTGADQEPVRDYPPQADTAARPLSMQQQRWLSLIKSRYGARVVPIVFYARLDETAFHRALSAVVDQHELLRYAFPNDQVRILAVDAVVAPPAELFTDVSGLDFDGRRRALADATRECWATMPDPAERPSWAIRCLKYPGDKFLLLLSLQHLDFDGTSLTTFVEELRAAYRAVLRAETPLVSEIAQYHEYVRSQQEYLADAVREDRAFFQGLYASLARTTTLIGHAGFERTVPQESARHTPEPVTGLWAGVQTTARDLGVTPFAVLLAGYARLIAEITDSGEVVIAMIVNGRSDQRFRATIGPFTAPFPVKVATASSPIAELAVQCHRVVAAITARSLYPVADLVTSVPTFKGFPIDSYFTDVGINFTNYRREETDLEPRVRVLEVLGPIVEPEFAAANTGELRRIPGLHLVIDIFDGELRPNFWYHVQRFTQAQVSDWADRYVSLLACTVGMQVVQSAGQDRGRGAERV